MQNRTKSDLANFFTYGILILMGIGVCVYSWLYYYRAPLLYDVEQYFIQSETGNITNWWSVLYMYETRWITQAINAIFPLQLDARAGLLAQNIIATFLLILAFCAVITLTSNKGKLIRFAYSCLLSCSIPILYYNGINYESSYIGNLDYHGTAYLIFAVVLTLFVKRDAGWKKCGILILIVALAMLQAVSFRKPFYVFVPIITYFLLCSLQEWSKVISIKSIAYTMLIFCGFYLTANILTPSRYKKMYPAECLLMSDLKIASILEGNPDYIISMLAPKLHLTADPRIIQADDSQQHEWARYRYIGNNLGLMNKPLDQEEEWHTLVEEYISYTLRHPFLIMEARLVKIWQFFSGNHVPMAFRKCIEKIHPHVKPTGLTMGTFYWPENTSSAAGNWRRWGCNILWLAGVILPFVYALFAWRKLTPPGKREVIGQLFYMSVATFCGIACYLTVVVSYIDYRYRIPATIMALIALILTCDQALHSKSGSK